MDLGEHELVRCSSLRVGHRNEAILPPLDASVGRGEFWAVIGRNGSGKTTLFETLLGLRPPVAGTAQRARGMRLSYLPQRCMFDDLFPLLARDVVRMGTERGASLPHPFAREPAIVRRTLDRLGVLELSNRTFRSLSEGQKQRVLLARILASEPDLALLDEPTSAMDIVAEREAFEVIDLLRREHGTTIMVVSHFIEVTRAFADHAILLDRESGTAVSGPIDDVLSHVSFRRSHFPAESRRQDARATKDHVV